MYDITDYTKKKAKQLGLIVKPSKNKKKKIDVFQQDKKIASIGDVNYGDYGTYLKKYGKIYATSRKISYHKRHQKDNKLNGVLSAYLLW